MPSITIPAGTSQVTLNSTTRLVSSLTDVTISATYAGQTQTASVVIHPLVVASLQVSPTGVFGGDNSTVTVQLSDKAPSDTQVSLGSSQPASGAVPTRVSVPGGSNQTSFAQATQRLAATTDVRLTA